MLKIRIEKWLRVAQYILLVACWATPRNKLWR